MKYGFLRVGAVSPDLKIANCKYNSKKIQEEMAKADESKCDLLVFPELAITGYSCGDLFFQENLIKSSVEELLKIAAYSQNLSGVYVIGLPLFYNGMLYNAAAVIGGGEIYGIVPKSIIPNSPNYNETRYFSSYKENLSGNVISSDFVVLNDDAVVPFGKMMFNLKSNTCDAVFAIEFAEELLSQNAPSDFYASCGAQIICNLSACTEIVGKSQFRNNAALVNSGKNICAYIYCEAGQGESSTDGVYSGEKFIYENSKLLARQKPFENNGILISDVDVDLLSRQRISVESFNNNIKIPNILIPLVSKEKNNIIRHYSKTPFVPESHDEIITRMAQILDIQAHALERRLMQVGAKNAVLGLSGGLDSTLALLVTAKAFDLAGLERKNIICITMPCFGTTDRTYNNACLLAEQINADLIEINIKDSVLSHFKDIGHDIDLHDVTFENSQARERTQILMDYANKVNGLVIGTGDLSELALGWATYNGDHMSMYGVNASVPKTLVRHLVKYYADISCDSLRALLYDILDTPVSPELLPPEDGSISQKTEDLVGPYELHDFFLYYFIRFGFSPEKIFFIACQTFKHEYSEAVISKWLKIFMRRFFTQQFKRSCMPDGPKIGSVCLSPRGAWKMPSDADYTLWTESI